MSKKYPECAKLKAEKYKTEIIHAFLEEVREKYEAFLCIPNFNDRSMDAVSQREVDKWMANFIGVDMNKVEEEKCQMLEECHTTNKEV